MMPIVFSGHRLLRLPAFATRMAAAVMRMLPWRSHARDELSDNADVRRQPRPSAGLQAYSFRRGALSREMTLWIDGDAVRWSDGHRIGSMVLSDIEEVQICRRYRPMHAALTEKLMWTCHLRDIHGQRLMISPLHYGGHGNWQDRSPLYLHFANVLIAHAYAARPQLRVTKVVHPATRLRRLLTKRLGGPAMVGLLAALRLMRCEQAAAVTAAAMRTIGPWLQGHRVARANLVAAFPAKSPDEIERILTGMWDNLGRVCAEYAHLDRLFDFDPATPSQRIVVDETNLERLQRLRTANRPVLLFGAHLANWELAAVAPAAVKLDFAALYRRPNFGVAATYLAALRTRSMGAVIAADRRGALQISRTLKRGGAIGMLVDQHANRGIDVTFFGRRCKVPPTLAHLARRFDCQVHGGRVIRLPDARYRVELTEPLELPRDRDAQIDISATMQLVTSMIETWIREHPEQWLWQHRRWR